MNKILLILTAIAFSASAGAPNKFFTRSGKVVFSASTPFEKIEAENDKGTSVLDPVTGQVEFAVLMKAFLFEKAMMQEHFNEKYVESDMYPKSVFKGTIENLGTIDFKKDGVYKLTASGLLTLHGITKTVQVSGILTVSKGVIMTSSEFQVAAADYGIEIPSLVRDKIAKVVTIKTEATYEVLNN